MTLTSRENATSVIRTDISVDAVVVIRFKLHAHVHISLDIQHRFSIQFVSEEKTHKALAIAMKLTKVRKVLRLILDGSQCLKFN